MALAWKRKHERSLKRRGGDALARGKLTGKTGSQSQTWSMFGLPPRQRQNPPVDTGGASAGFGESPRHLGRGHESSGEPPGAGHTVGSRLEPKHLLPPKQCTYLPPTLLSLSPRPLTFYRNISSAVLLLWHAWLSYPIRLCLRCCGRIVRLASPPGVSSELLDWLMLPKDKSTRAYYFFSFSHRRRLSLLHTLNT